MSIDPKIIDKLKERYHYLHPLLIHRSVERAKTAADLFDILDTVPDGFPLIWNENQRRWIKINDLFLADNFFKKGPDVSA